tara:strand:+ start:12 stop:656 length:645 start_codon:yes stop_codon:yes gene_type:complete
MNDFKLSIELQKRIKNTIDRYSHDQEKKQGYSEICNWYAKGYLTQSQAEKTKSFYNTFIQSSATPKDIEKKKLLDEINILPWINSNLTHAKNVKKTITNTKKITGNGSQKGRSVDRLTKVTNASLTPPAPPTSKDLMPNIHEEINRIKDLMCYDMNEGLKMTMYKVTYQINKGARITTDIGLYSASELHALQRLKERMPSLKGKNIVILNITRK